MFRAIRQVFCFHTYNKTGGKFYFWGIRDVQFRQLQRCSKCGKERIIRLDRKPL